MAAAGRQAGRPAVAACSACRLHLAVIDTSYTKTACDLSTVEPGCHVVNFQRAHVFWSPLQ
jgi:hypothetical protein